MKPLDPDRVLSNPELVDAIAELAKWGRELDAAYGLGEPLDELRKRVREEAPILLRKVARGVLAPLIEAIIDERLREIEPAVFEGYPPRVAYDGPFARGGIVRGGIGLVGESPVAPAPGRPPSDGPEVRVEFSSCPACFGTEGFHRPDCPRFPSR